MASDHRPTKTDKPGSTSTTAVTRTDRLISDVTFVRLGGGAEVVAVGLVVVSIAVSVTTGLPRPDPDPATLGAWLSAVDAASSTYRAITWLFVIDHLLEILFMVALYHVLRDVGGVMRLAFVAGVLGLVMVASSGVAQVGLLELAGGYVAAGEATRSGILASAVALERVRLVLNLTGTVLAWGVGGALFSSAILRTKALPRWVGWGGLLFAVVVWSNALRLVSPTFEPLVVVMLVVGLVWLPSIGLSLVRIDPDRIPGHG